MITKWWRSKVFFRLLVQVSARYGRIFLQACLVMVVIKNKNEAYLH